MRFIFTCGGTAGHINPALAIASKIREVMPSSEFLFIGAEGQMETSLVPLAGFNIQTVNITNISREINFKGLAHNLDTAKNVIQSTAAAKKIIKNFNPDIVIGTGGYVCFPVIEAAASMGIPTVIHESNAAPGLTSRLLAHRVDKVFIGMQGSEKYYPEGVDVTFTGTPVRDEFSLYTKESAKEELGIKKDKPVVLSVWGSLGAEYMNYMVLKMIPIICEENPDFHFIHATGGRYYNSFMSELQSVCPYYSDFNIDVREYIHDMPRVMIASDLIMCRAGASTLSELSYIAKPAILIPSPNVVDNHQEKNARVLEKAGGAKVLLESEFDEKSLYDSIKNLVFNTECLSLMSASMTSMASKDAASDITDIILKMIK